jgi:Mrp family chromosome partitioning ATPase
MQDELEEAYRKIASALAQGVREKRLQQVLFCSATRGEGTTTVVLNVAHKLDAMHGLRCLIVDVNGRTTEVSGKATVATGTQRASGVAVARVKQTGVARERVDAVAIYDFLRGKPRIQTGYSTVDVNGRTTEVSGKAAAATGTQRASGVAVARVKPTGVVRELVEAVAEMLKGTEAQYDIVLIDSPPVLETADTLVLGQLVPQTVLVVEAARTRYEVLERAKSELAQANMVLVGTVLSKQRRYIPNWIYRWLVR